MIRDGKRWLAMVLGLMAVLFVFLRTPPARASAAVWPLSGPDRIERVPERNTEYARSPSPIRLERTRSPRSPHPGAAPLLGAFAPGPGEVGTCARFVASPEPSTAPPFALPPSRARSRLMVFLN